MRPQRTTRSNPVSLLKGGSKLRKTFFILLSSLLVAVVAVIPSGSIAAKPDSSPPVSAPVPAQQEEEQDLRDKILEELTLARTLTDDASIQEQIDDFINRVKKLGWLEFTGQEEDALKLKYIIAEQLERLINELPLATAGMTTATAAAPVSNPLYEELVRIRAKIERLIYLETVPEELPPPPPTLSRPPDMERLIVYSAKFLCGPAFGKEGVQRGSYSTAINIHNPHNGTVYLYKKAVIANREDEPRGKISAFRKVKLGPDEAIEIDCVDIDSLLGYQQDVTRLSALSRETETGLTAPSLQTTIRSVGSLVRFIKGFVVVYSTAPLDVVAVYTASTTVGFSLDVEYLSPSTVTTLPVPPPPEEARCPDGCRCLTKLEAEEVGYTAWCRGEIKICGYDDQQNERYCFEKPTVVEECPPGCVCKTQLEARRLGLSLCQGKQMQCGLDEDGYEMYCYEKPTEEACPQGCVCLTGAEVRKLGYPLCQGKQTRCGFDEEGNEIYCYEIPTEEVECPQGCLCLTEAEAREGGYTWCQGVVTECGLDATTGATKYCFEKYTCPRGCACLSKLEADEKGYPLCEGKEIRCGTDASGIAMYCYEESTEEEACPQGCRCLTELEAKKLGYTWCQGERIPCDYVPGGPTKWCFEEAVPGRITIDPTQDSNPIGTTHTVTVFVYDSYGNPLPNVTVNVSVSGANSYASGTITTNADGKATFDYSGKNVGTDIIVATVDNLSATAYKDWYRR